MRASFDIGGQSVAPGDRRTVDIPLNVLSNHTPMSLPVHVIHGRRAGPTLFVSAAIHGDEIIGVEVIRRLLRSRALGRLKGTLLAVPIVNAYGFIGHTRYLPDRRDLNRSFPGNPIGSMASQLAHVFMTEIVSRSDYGIDLHSAAIHRTNLPQVRGDLSKPVIIDLATAFGTPVMLHANLRDGSLRQAAQNAGIDILLYEAGEALRLDELSIRAGVRGVLRVLQHLGMIRARKQGTAKAKPVMSKSSQWVRAPASGMFRATSTIGEQVAADAPIGFISDPLGDFEVQVPAPISGIIVGRTNLPVINQGDGLFHIAKVADTDIAGERVEEFIGDLDLPEETGLLETI